MIKWIGGTKPGRTGLQVPYNATFLEEIKRMIPSIKNVKGESGWTLFMDEDDKSQAAEIAERYFGGSSQTFVASFDLSKPGSGDNIYVDGVALLYTNRDFWKWRSPPEGVKVKVVACALEPYGSRNNPSITGTCTLQITARDGAVLKPVPVDVKVIA